MFRGAVGSGSASHHWYMTDPSRASGSVGQEVLPGVPVHEIFPTKDIWEDILVDPLTISKLTRLNHFLFHKRYDFFDRVIQAGNIQSLQRELNPTPPRLLPEKLDFMLNQEYVNLYHFWYSHGVQNPLSLCREYENWCHFWCLKTLDIPSPLEPFNYAYTFILFFFIICISVIGILRIFGVRKNKKRKEMNDVRRC